MQLEVKRPPSVTAAIVVFGLFAAFSVIPAFSVPKGQLTANLIVIYIVMFLVHIVGAVGLTRARTWARWYCIVILTLWALLMAALTLFGAISTANWFNVIPGVLVAVPLGWLIWALLFGQPCRTYFSQQ